jgi:Family of unknown function (DUF5343)
MALPQSYLTSVKNLQGILNAIRSAQAPYKFTRSFLETLGFKANADRFIIGVLKSLGLLDEGGRPTQRYFEYLDRTQSERLMADAIWDAYADLFKVNIKANEMSKQDVISKLKMLSQGKISEAVLNKMAMTFTALVKHGDFSSAGKRKADEEPKLPKEDQDTPSKQPNDEKGLNSGGPIYKIQLVLPETCNQAVYDALFQSLRKHLR